MGGICAPAIECSHSPLLHARDACEACRAAHRCRRHARPRCHAVQKRVQKKQQVVLTRDVPGLGSEGSLKAVPTGYWRNYLQPQGLAAFADDNILEQVRNALEIVELLLLLTKQQELLHSKCSPCAAGKRHAGLACRCPAHAVLLLSTQGPRLCACTRSRSSARNGAALLPAWLLADHALLPALAMLLQIRRQREEEERVKAEEKAKAQAMVRRYTWQALLDVCGCGAEGTAEAQAMVCAVQAAGMHSMRGGNTHMKRVCCLCPRWDGHSPAHGVLLASTACTAGGMAPV